MIEPETHLNHGIDEEANAVTIAENSSHRTSARAEIVKAEGQSGLQPHMGSRMPRPAHQQHHLNWRGSELGRAMKALNYKSYSSLTCINSRTRMQIKVDYKDKYFIAKENATSNFQKKQTLSHNLLCYR
jgi:hypothetical protein